MREPFQLKIKRQPFPPHFVLQLDELEVPARVSKLNEECVVAHIEGKGAYTIDIRGVGFFFVEKMAEPYKNGPAPPSVEGSVLRTIMRTAVRTLGEHCGDVAAELTLLRDAFWPYVNEKRGEQV